LLGTGVDGHCLMLGGAGVDDYRLVLIAGVDGHYLRLDAGIDGHHVMLSVDDLLFDCQMLE